MGLYDTLFGGRGDAERKKAIRDPSLVTPDNPAGIAFKQGGAVKGWGAAKGTKKAKYI